MSLVCLTFMWQHSIADRAGMTLLGAGVVLQALVRDLRTLFFARLIFALGAAGTLYPEKDRG